MKQKHARNEPTLPTPTPKRQKNEGKGLVIV